MVEQVALLVQPTPRDHGLVAEHLPGRLGERLAAVEQEQHARRGVAAPVAQIRDQAARDRRVLGRPFDQPERHLRPVGGHAERADPGVAGEVEPVEEHAQPALALERTGTKRGQPLGGRGERCPLDAPSPGNPRIGRGRPRVLLKSSCRRSNVEEVDPRAMDERRPCLLDSRPRRLPESVLRDRRERATCPLRR
jgi:hypothetical protein